MVRNILFYFKYIAKTTLTPNVNTKTHFVTINSLQNFETSVSLLNQTMFWHGLKFLKFQNSLIKIK